MSRDQVGVAAFPSEQLSLEDRPRDFGGVPLRHQYIPHMLLSHFNSIEVVDVFEHWFVGKSVHDRY